MQNFFVDPKREKRRLQRERSRLADILWYSNVNDYYRLRLVLNSLVGLFVCTGVYYMVCRRLNFLDFNVYTALILQLAFIVGAAWAFATSSMFRCAIICVCLGALGRTGQGLFALFVVERLTDGPIENIVHNFQLSSSIVICHLEIQSKITAQRVALTAGPVEALLEKQLGNSVTIGRKIIHSLKALLGSFGGDLRTTSEEDDTIASVIDNAQALSDRQFLVDGGGVLVNETTTAAPITETAASMAINTTDGNATGTAGTLTEDQKPVWARFKSALARAVSHRFVRRCEEMYASAVKSCHERLENVQSLCYDKTPSIIAYFTCRRMNALNLCQPGAVTSVADKYCERGIDLEGSNGTSSLLSPDLDTELENVQNVSHEITNQLKLNLHFQAIEEPAREHIRALDEIRAEVQSDVETFRVILNTIEDLLSALLVFLLYWIFRDVLSMIGNYLTDLDFRNNFLTNEFYYLDAKRRRRGRINFHDQPLTEEEMKHHELLYPFSFPTKAELMGNWMPLLRWIVLVLVVTIIVALDHFLYRVLMLVVKFGGQTSEDSTTGPPSHASFAGEHTLQITVKGEGPIAEMIKEILDFRFSKSVRQDLANEMCLTRPRAPDWSAVTLWLIVPLLIMLLLQLVFSFLISRVTILHVMSFMFRRRAKERAQHLYRKLMAHREGRVLRAKKLGLIVLDDRGGETTPRTPTPETPSK